MTKENKKFRPSDWIERLSSLGGNWESGYFRFNNNICPTIFNGIKALRLDFDLQNHDPELFIYIVNFANNNNLIIHEIKE